MCMILAIVNSEYVNSYLYADALAVQICCKDSTLVNGLVNIVINNVNLCAVI